MSDFISCPHCGVDLPADRYEIELDELVLETILRCPECMGVFGKERG